MNSTLRANTSRSRTLSQSTVPITCLYSGPKPNLCPWKCQNPIKRVINTNLCYHALTACSFGLCVYVWMCLSSLASSRVATGESSAISLSHVLSVLACALLHILLSTVPTADIMGAVRHGPTWHGRSAWVWSWWSLWVRGVVVPWMTHCIQISALQMLISSFICLSCIRKILKSTWNHNWLHWPFLMEACIHLWIKKKKKLIVKSHNLKNVSKFWVHISPFSLFCDM